MRLKIVTILCIILFSACDAPAQKTYTPDDRKFKKLTAVAYPNYEKDFAATKDDSLKGVRYFSWLDNALAPFELEKIYLSQEINDMNFILYHWKSNYEQNVRVISMVLAKKEKGTYKAVSSLPEEQMIIYSAEADKKPKIKEVITWGSYPAIVIEDEFFHPEKGVLTLNKKIYALIEGKELKQVYAYAERSRNKVKETYLLPDEVIDPGNPVINDISNLHDAEKEFLFDRLERVEIIETENGMPNFKIHTYNYTYDATAQKLLIDKQTVQMTWKKRGYIYYN